MKRGWILILAICLLCMLGGCAQKEKTTGKSEPTALVAYAAYQYEEGYQAAEGWMYDMVISAQEQLKELEELTRRMKLTMRDEMFDHGRGYYLAFRDEQGNTTDHLLILENGTVSRDGLIYEADGSDALLAWLHGLQIEEQDIE